MTNVAKLGCYVLPGGVADPRPAISQAQAAEAIGFGTTWIGERYDTKDLPSLAGALSQMTDRVRIAAGVTHMGTRHPMAIASMGQTLQMLSNSRFQLGFGRSANWRWRAYGIPKPTSQILADTAGILRRLWAGETVTYDGPVGRFPELRLPQRPDVAPPAMILAAVGPRTLELAGTAFDGVLLHPFLTPDAVARSVAIVRDAARRSGRDPDTLRCYATVVAAPDQSPDDAALAVNSRAAGYLHVGGLGDSIVAINGWSAADLRRYREQPQLAELGGQQADKALSRQDLISLTEALPSDWIPSSSAVGSAAECAARLSAYVDAGADELVLHGSTAEQLSGLAAAFGERPLAWR